MEHRCSRRKPITAEVIVECPRVGLVRADMLDVSLGGLLLETRSGVLPLNAAVSVIFDLPASERSGGFCLQAMVVRHTPTGAGLMFLDPDVDTVRSMRNSLYGRTQSGESRGAEISPG